MINLSLFVLLVSLAYMGSSIVVRTFNGTLFCARDKFAVRNGIIGERYWRCYLYVGANKGLRSIEYLGFLSAISTGDYWVGCQYNYVPEPGVRKEVRIISKARINGCIQRSIEFLIDGLGDGKAAR